MKAYAVHPGYIATPLMRHSPPWVHVVMALGGLLSRLGLAVAKSPEQVGGEVWCGWVGRGGLAEAGSWQVRAPRGGHNALSCLVHGCEQRVVTVCVCVTVTVLQSWRARIQAEQQRQAVWRQPLADLSPRRHAGCCH